MAALIVKTLRASHCTLEPLVADHAREMFTVLGDPRIYEFENEPPPSEDWLRQRYGRLESRASPDGKEKWLNWVIRLPGGELAGCVQATILPSGASYVAYEIASRYWRRGIGSSAVRAMLEELGPAYGVHTFVAVFKEANYRSSSLLRRLGFTPASPLQAAQYGAGEGEQVLCMASANARDAT